MSVRWTRFAVSMWAGETLFPLAKIASVRSMCAMLKMQGIAEYRTRIDHENKAIHVKRTK